MTKTSITLQELRRKIYIKAKAEPSHRFWGIYVHMCKFETLEVVRDIFRMYTEDSISIGAVAKVLMAQKIPTRRTGTRWERSVIWATLGNPAYSGKACLGKTERAERQRMTKLLRAKGGHVKQNGCNREKPREE